MKKSSYAAFLLCLTLWFSNRIFILYLSLESRAFCCLHARSTCFFSVPASLSLLLSSVLASRSPLVYISQALILILDTKTELCYGSGAYYSPHHQCVPTR
jgi:hypothetical protein